MHQMETINRRTWENPWSIREYGRSTGFLDDGERVAFTRAMACSPRRVLDIGVGGGRTTALLAEGRDYVGIDYTARMVEQARANHPSLRFEHMDARDLSAFPAASFDLVVFSFNGIDSVNPEGRMQILKEVSRVLAPSGQFVFSTFHKDWEGFADLPDYRRIDWTLDPLRLGFRIYRYVEGGILKVIRLRRHRALEVHAEDHAIRMHAAHDFGIMIHATTRGHLLSQLADVGFAADPDLFDRQGVRLGPDWPSQLHFLYVVATKPPIS
jgi:SAM-dependent methyltransferase